MYCVEERRVDGVVCCVLGVPWVESEGPRRQGEEGYEKTMTYSDVAAGSNTIRSTRPIRRQDVRMLFKRSREAEKSGFIST